MSIEVRSISALDAWLASVRCQISL